MNPRISIIIIVKNERGIANTIEALRHQQHSVPTEVIVVDASDPLTLKDIRELYPEVSWYQFEPRVSGKTSIPEQRNEAVRRAKGDIIVFIDATCIPVDGWLALLTKPILEENEYISSGPFGATDISSRIHAINDSVAQYVTSSGTGNLAFAKVVWENINGFDEQFLYGSDVDFTWRCIDAGYTIRYISDASVSHDWGTDKENLHRFYKYGKARADLFVKHPRRILGQLLGETKLLTAYSLWIFLLPLTWWYPWYPATILIFVIKNIRTNPLKTIGTNLVYTFGFYWRLFTKIFGI
ncbi:MAG: glycosyltransferase [Candidatus Yonathbacteria bacterium]|nr:glycosyltransferase [Candidatus Yonathbacteria bacterium]NTW47937.1 glycosyltransferase [Candidatus Yonathbacteria bacterium]